MLMGMAGLFQRDEVEWMTSMTYQAASGAGAAQHARAGRADGARRRQRDGAARRSGLGDPRHRPRGDRFDPLGAHLPKRRASAIRSPASLLPWIDKDLGNGQSREEWKAQAETNKILGRNGSGRSRSTAFACASARCAATARR